MDKRDRLVRTPTPRSGKARIKSSRKSSLKGFRRWKISFSNLTPYLTAQVTEELLPLSGVSPEWKVASSKGSSEDAMEYALEKVLVSVGRHIKGKEQLKQLGYPDRGRPFFRSSFPACSLLRSLCTHRIALILRFVQLHYITQSNYTFRQLTGKA